MATLPCPPESQIFTLDGEKYKGISAFIDRILSKDIRVTPEQADVDMARAKSFGFEHPAEAIGSVNKRMGLSKPDEAKGKETADKLKSAQSEYDKAQRELKSAEDKISQKQATQTGMFGDAAQKEMFGVGRDEAKEILDPLRNKVKEAKQKLDDAQKEASLQEDKQQELFDQPKREPYQYLKDIPDKELEQASRERKREQFDSKIDAAVDKILSLPGFKSDPNIQKMGVGMDDIVKAAADIIKRAYHAGQDIKKAINDAIDYIRDHWDRKTMGEFDENDIADKIFDSGAFTIDEEIETRYGLTPQEVLDIWNSVDAGRSNPELLDFIQKLSGADKTKVVKDALRGVVSDKLQQFVRVVKTKTGNKIEILNKEDFQKAMDEKIAEELRKEADKREQTLKDIDDAIKASQQSKPLLKQITDSKMFEKVGEVLKGIALAFHPALFDGKELARDAMTLIRKEKGKEAQQNEIADNASFELMRDWNNVPRKEKIGFILSIENPTKYGKADPKFRKLADTYRQRMDAVWDMLSQIKDIPYLEDYFPHFWEKPEKARAHFASVYSKRPFEGNKSFLKQRFYADVLEGLKAGLKLATYNPEEMVRLAEMNALKFKTAHDIFNEMKDRGMLKFFKNGAQPEGWKLVDDPLFKRMALFTVKDAEGNTEAAMKNGGYYMPEPVARVVNNYLSRGLSGAGPVGRNIYEAVRGWNNFKNLFQLGVGFFHFTTTTIDATVTGAGNAVSKILAGKLKGLEDLVDAFLVLPNIGKTLVYGHYGIKAYHAGLLGADVQAMVDANARTGLQKIYTLDSYYNMQKAVGRLRFDWDDMTAGAKVGEAAKATWNALMTLPELISKPLMQWYVPRLKVGGYLRTLENELNLKKNLTPEQILREKQKIWDDMDDRLGQMVYDNLFWHKTMKDLAFLTIRSFGWTGGTIRAFGKGIGDIPKSAVRLVKGEGISPRTAWLTMLPVTVGTYGAMYQYMMTGQWPQELEDYFFPWDGTYNSDGTKHRVTLPSYMKDFFSYGNHPFETLAHKTAPSVNEAIEVFSNKDFYGTQIFNPKDPLYLNGLQLMEYEGKSLIPFSFKEQTGEKPTTRQWIEQKFGIMPATKEFQRTQTQNLIIQEVSKGYGQEAKTSAEADRITARREIRERLFKGETWDSLPDELKKKAAYTDKTEKEVIKDAQLDPYKRMFRDLKSEQQLNVWSKMTPSEKNDFGQFLNNKASFEALHDQKPEIFEEDPSLQKAYEEIEGIAHETRGGKGQKKAKKMRAI